MDTQSTLLPLAEKTNPAEALAKSWRLPDWMFVEHEPCQSSPTVSEMSAPAITIQEAANLLRVSPRTVRRLISRGEIQAVRIGRSVRLTPAFVMKVLEP